MGGQGMNVSIQDSYNLIWKIGEVLTGHANPLILATYESERRPVAEKLMNLDSLLVNEYEYEGSKDPRYISQARGNYAGFMSGVDVTYGYSALVDNRTEDEANRIAKNIKLGMRIPSVSLLYQCDGTQEHLGRRLRSDGSWRLLVFPGDLREEGRMDTLHAFADVFMDLFQMKPREKKLAAKKHFLVAECILIHSSSRNAVNLLDLPAIFHPFDDRLGWDYWKVFAEDDRSPAYQMYGIEREGPCCLVLCRPDQHVAWIGRRENVNDLKTYLSRLCSNGLAEA
jgi:phenol 2-monooxygenase (NADPH)